MPEERSPGRVGRKPNGKNGIPIDKFPAYVLEEIDDFIFAGDGATKIYNHIALGHPKLTPLPDVSTFHRYIQARRLQIEADQILQMSIAQGNKNINLRRLDTTSDPEVIEALLVTTLQQVELYKRFSRGSVNSAGAKAYNDSLGKVVDLLALRMKLESHGKLMETRMALTVNVLAKHLVAGIAKVYKDIHGEKKLKEFSESLDSMIRGLDLEAVEKELTEALTPSKKERL